MNIIEEMDIEKISYPDFVGLTGQENTPPGGMSTIDYWCKFGGIDKESMLLDLACSTGFSSRMCSQKTGSSAYGIDLSKPSICSATHKSIKKNNLSYLVADATELPFKDQLFTHILGGCNFGFIQDREKSLIECSRVLKSNGKLCIGTHFYKETPPEEILDLVKSSINFRPCGHWSKEWWISFFEKHFKLTDIKVVELPVVEEEKIKKWCKGMIEEQSLNVSNERKEQLINRLIDIRLVLNRHRNYQSFFQAIFEKK